ncbi:GNAT family N-acetyltransferase [Oleiharenicola lentus]|uniref:GNAT family N-acetyltransferase n=1 Tax=Oleiharenicola lentus TaxID=2508720 RepID=UPI003F66CEE2
MNPPPRLIAATERLQLNEFTAADAAFVVTLLNEPLWHRFIGDRGIRTVEDAVSYLQKGPIASYAKNGFGLWAVRLKNSQTPIGMCGLIKRDTLEDIDVGFAFLEKHSGHGYATEAASAVLHYGWTHAGLKRIVAITDSQNDASIRVLEKIGLRFEKNIALPSDGKIGNLYAIAAPARNELASAEV